MSLAMRSSLLTRRWRKTDSNPRSPVREPWSMAWTHPLRSSSRIVYVAGQWRKLSPSAELTDEATCRSKAVIDRSFCELDPAVTDIVLGVLGRHFDGAIEADIDVSAREGLHGADAGRRPQANRERPGVRSGTRFPECEPPSRSPIRWRSGSPLRHATGLC